ncbi:glycosyltransferase [Adlercreutzia caecimuris]|jgi:Glycosyltransferases involved in cell wall biogenesis|uniref:glycosyltransferase n=1 Tax=Adlercreutzia caecimuris TaxID=671266 RepID=UPI001C3C9446|nr:glycosyltransferase [Adlercreutzia caecimuris]
MMAALMTHGLRSRNSQSPPPALQDGHIIALRFSRNFGKEAAIWAGINNAGGDIIGIIDVDLQQPPSDALAMCEILEQNPQYDCVAAFQETRRESGLMAKVKGSFYSLFAKLSSMDAIHNASDFRVFRRTVADAIRSLPESFRFSKGIFAWIGFNTLPYPYVPKERVAGDSKWSVAGLFKYAIEGMLAFSVAPLRIATVLGLIAALCAVVYFAIILIQTLVEGVEVPGYATLMSVVLLLGGAQLVCTGIMGEYLARTYLQGKNRPIYIEKQRIDSREL